MAEETDPEREPVEPDDPSEPEGEPEGEPAPDEGDEDDEDAGPPPPEPLARAGAYLGLATLASAVGTWFAFAPENAATPGFLPPMALAYAPLVLLALARLRATGRLREQLQPRRGDLGYGGLVAAALYGCVKIAQFAFAGPGTSREAWVMHLSLFLGEPRSDVERMLTGMGVLGIGACEELVWRGLVQDALLRTTAFADERRRRHAIGLTALAFGLAHVTTMFRLALPGVGPNPLLVLAGVGASVLWGWIAARNERLAPALFAHALFSWGVFEFPLWRP